MKVLFANKNLNNLNEICAVLDNFSVISMKDLNIDIDVIEDGKTYEENAEKKATAIMKATGLITLADDSGLEVDFLDKQPGVHSARFLGENTSYDIKNKHILELLKDVPNAERQARFVCAIVAVFPDGSVLRAKSTIEGYIAHEPKGNNGFGYDPIFFVPEFGMTTAQMSPELKNKISHRGKALRKMREILLQHDDFIAHS